MPDFLAAEPPGPGFAGLGSLLALLDWPLAPMSFDELVTASAVLLWLLLLMPAAYFLWFGWKNRRADVFNSFSPRAAVYYLRCFQPDEARTVLAQVDKAGHTGTV